MSQRALVADDAPQIPRFPKPSLINDEAANPFRNGELRIGGGEGWILVTLHLSSNILILHHFLTTQKLIPDMIPDTIREVKRSQ
jgi:hypothetical protein